jgi:hypothetical protein
MSWDLAGAHVDVFYVIEEQITCHDLKTGCTSKFSGKVLAPFYSSKKSTNRGTPIFMEAIEALELVWFVSTDECLGKITA